ncbi:ABC transporter permease [Endozoicomonas sp. SM1973]|uniref:Transport permease protein n=1 Tax=Spartinivicinus marinus TaxID=2994442 RepID=A0A853I3Y5_9GAMM|nr:ABC transporter permease [Spartinivicinus marinus]MCX4028361.1 ABC transporter permease [Spartinivicinus marinus]NYZ68640.1 ABC transporter permease [Spartinivicinus marinus]
MLNLKPFIAIFIARTKEFYRDKAAWSWSLIMPFLLVIGFNFALSDSQRQQYKVGVVGKSTEQLNPLKHLKFIEFVYYHDQQQAIDRVKYHQLDLLIKAASTQVKYWINSDSTGGYFMEQLLLQQAVNATKQTVTGREIRYVDWVMPGILGMNIMFSALYGVGFVIVRYRKNGVLKRLKATPLSALQFITAQACSRLVIILLISLTLYLGCYLTIDFLMLGSLIDLLVVLLTGGASMIAMGLIIASRISTEEVADGILNAIAWPMMFLSGVWFSLDDATQTLQLIANLMPLNHMVTASREIMINGASLVDISNHLLIMAIFTVVCLVIAASFFRWERN